jgi:hypothetical protein
MNVPPYRLPLQPPTSRPESHTSRPRKVGGAALSHGSLHDQGLSRTRPGSTLGQCHPALEVTGCDLRGHDVLFQCVPYLRGCLSTVEDVKHDADVVFHCVVNCVGKSLREKSVEAVRFSVDTGVDFERVDVGEQGVQEVVLHSCPAGRRIFAHDPSPRGPPEGS